jgi:hypothetical protein|tara:strand:+ start:2528 stop:3133 length:606 start_codon:yes stop_codon:yes gene_type:complete
MATRPTPENLKEVLFEGPVPGQALTNAPDQAYPWEQPPEMTSVKEAREKIFLDLLEPQRLKGVQDLMLNDISVNAIAEVVLTEGFRKGKFNPDMMLNLLEPTMYMLMAIAEKSGIEPIVDSDDQGFEEEDEETVQNAVNERNQSVREGQRFRDVKVKTIQPTAVGQDIQDRLEKIDTAKVQASLLQKPLIEKRENLLGQAE